MRDSLGISLSRPSSWLRGVRTETGIWRERPFTRVGAVASEFEFQRYQPRRQLTELLGGCDVIQVVCGSPAWAWAVRGLGKPVTVLCATLALIERRRRDSTSKGTVADWRRMMTRWTDRLDRKALQAADAIQVLNPWMLDFARNLNRGRAVIVRNAPPGVDARRFSPLPRRDLNSDPYVLCVGRLSDPRKNIGLLLEAYARLPSDVRARARLVLAGSSGPGPEFWARTDALRLRHRVTFVSSPSREELIRLYRAATVFALSSDEEGLGVVILEAMACGIPVVSTRSGGPDGIITEGVDGYLVGRDDAAEMAERLGRLLSDQADNCRMGHAARVTVMQRYETGVTSKVFLDLYDELMTSISKPLANHKDLVR